jgi:hypothetical protein
MVGEERQSSTAISRLPVLGLWPTEQPYVSPGFPQGSVSQRSLTISGQWLVASGQKAQLSALGRRPAEPLSVSCFPFPVSRFLRQLLRTGNCFQIGRPSHRVIPRCGIG